MKNSKPIPPRRLIGTTKTTGRSSNSKSSPTTTTTVNNSNNNKTSATYSQNNSNNNKKTTSDKSEQQPINKSNHQICDICAENVPGPAREQIFAFGECDHYVCYVCSARLRVICDQPECPICRKTLDNVLFCTKRNVSYQKYNLQNCIKHPTHGIYFSDEKVREAFEELFKIKCLECGKDSDHPSSKPEADSSREASGVILAFKTISEFKRHLRMVHDKKLCDQCLNHDKVFPFEYSYYGGYELLSHMKVGKENTSHRGHPQCELCKKYYFNNDELLTHMSREHFHCHLCGRESDSNIRVYFADYPSLREHFKTSHYLCERDQCRNEQFTSAFDSEFDYRMHLMEVHGNPNASLRRGELTFPLESVSHRDRASQSSPSRTRRPPVNGAIVTTGNMATANNSRRAIPEPIIAQVRLQRQALPTIGEFPVLGQNPTSGDGSGAAGSSSRSSTNISQRFITQPPVVDATSYPSLSSSSSASTPAAPAAGSNMIPTRLVVKSARATGSAPVSSLIAGPSNARSSFVQTLGGSNPRPESLNDSDFPPLPEAPKKKGNKKSKSKPAQKNSSQTKIDSSNLTLEQLISNSLRISANVRSNHKSGNSSKPAKQKPLKIQL